MEPSANQANPTGVAASKSQKSWDALLALCVGLFPIIFVWFLLKKRYSWRARLAGFAWLGFLLYTFLPLAFYNTNQEKAAVAAKLEVENKLAHDKRAEVDYFNANSAKVLTDIKDYMAAKQFGYAFGLADKYAASGNQVLLSLRDKAGEELAKAKRAEQVEATKTILTQLKTVPASDTSSRFQMYKRLVEMNPENKEYQKVLDALTVKQQEQAVQAEIAKTALLARYGKAPLQTDISGSSIAVKNYLKERLNDPGSLDMVGCTRAELTKGGWQLDCTYRAKNAFGALVKESHTFWLQNDRVLYMNEE